MNWDAFGAIAEAVGAIGVVASLFYLGRQLHQNSKSISEEVFQNLLRDYHGAIDHLISDRELNRIWYLGFRDFDAMDADERRLWSTQVHANFRRYENIILRSRQYDVDESVINGIQNQWQALLTQPGAKKWWPRAYAAYSNEFVNFVAQRHDLHIEGEPNDA